MTDEEKAAEIGKLFELSMKPPEMIGRLAAEEMAEWKEQQMVELWNVARNVYEAWMGGTMDDVRECMKDLGHVFYEFKN